MAEGLLFVLMGFGALVGAVTVVLARNPIYSAMGLLGTLLSVAVLYVAQLAHLVAAVQVIVYAGAVLTLFLFVIMMIGVDRSESRDETLPYQRWVGWRRSSSCSQLEWPCSVTSTGCPRRQRSTPMQPMGRFLLWRNPCSLTGSWPSRRPPSS